MLNALSSLAYIREGETATIGYHFGKFDEPTMSAESDDGDFFRQSKLVLNGELVVMSVRMSSVCVRVYAFVCVRGKIKA